jgi:glycosyltransferase involved in cell wall biosynthesis
MYSGNLGRMHHFEMLLAAADRLRGDPEFLFLLAGSGPALGSVRAQAEARGLRNFLIHSMFPESVLREALGLASVHVITLRESALGVSVPGKLYGIMAAARPVIFLGPARSEVALAIEEEQCGFVVAEHDTECLVRLLGELRANPLLLQKLGARGRRAFLQRYRESHVCLQFCQQIERAARLGAAARLVDTSFSLNSRPSE